MTHGHLERCPFCNSKAERVGITHSGVRRLGLGIYGFAECDECGARGPKVRTSEPNWEQQAADMWNFREGV